VEFAAGERNPWTTDVYGTSAPEGQRISLADWFLRPGGAVEHRLPRSTGSTSLRPWPASMTPPGVKAAPLHPEEATAVDDALSQIDNRQSSIENWQSAIGNSRSTTTDPCSAFDFDTDGDVDLLDFAAFSRLVFGGQPSAPTDPNAGP